MCTRRRSTGLSHGVRKMKSTLLVIAAWGLRQETRQWLKMVSCLLQEVPSDPKLLYQTDVLTTKGPWGWGRVYCSSGRLKESQLLTSYPDRNDSKL